ncbi:MAG: glycosyltransferase [Halobacteriaceae archaeon]
MAKEIDQKVYADEVTEISADLSPQIQEFIDEDTVDHPADPYIVGADDELTPTLSVILPTLNEEKAIGDCIAQIKNAVATLEIPTEIIVSDNSDDHTPIIARGLGAKVITPDMGMPISTDLARPAVSTSR